MRVDPVPLHNEVWGHCVVAAVEACTLLLVLGFGQEELEQFANQV